MTASLEEEERSLTALYAQRQDLLKELTEVDNQIKALELKQSQRQQTLQQQKQAVLAISTGDKDLDSIRDVIEKATHDQAGLREAQKAIEAACRSIERLEGETDEDLQKRKRYRNLFIQQVIERSTELMVDPHGNYFVQRALSFFKNDGSVPPPAGSVDYDVETDTSISEVVALLEHLGNSICDISCNMHGTRAVQRVIDSLASIEEFELFCDLVANDLVALIKDLNGNHSISRLLVSQAFMKLGESEPGAAVTDPELKEKGQNVRKDVYHIVASNCVEICRNRQGCCIIQRCLQWAPEPFRTEIINAALLNSLKLVQDPFGNYVVQYILDLQQQLVQNSPQEAETLNYTNRIIRQILHNVALLSCNKFSSNVIEKCLKTASPDVRQLLIDELTDPHALPKLLTDSFANYVVQTAITTATDEAQFAQLRDAILPLQHLLKNSPYGIKIEAKLMKRHRDTAKKLNRQIRAARDSQRTVDPRSSAQQGSMQPQNPGQQQPPQQHRDAMAQGSLANHQIAQPIRIAPPTLGAFPMPPSGGPQDMNSQLAFFQQAANAAAASHSSNGGIAPQFTQQQAQPFGQMPFMMPPQQLINMAQGPAGQQAFSPQAQQSMMVSLQQQQQQHQQHQQQHPQLSGQQSSWAVSSQGNYTAMQHQHQAPPRGVPVQPNNKSSQSTSQATHSPYTTYTAPSF